jgi:hypothetical protein
MYCGWVMLCTGDILYIGMAENQDSRALRERKERAY